MEIFKSSKKLFLTCIKALINFDIFTNSYNITIKDKITIMVTSCDLIDSDLDITQEKKK